MPVNPYDDRKVSLRRPHGNGDLDIVGASYTRKANVTEALRLYHVSLDFASDVNDDIISSAMIYIKTSSPHDCQCM